MSAGCWGWRSGLSQNSPRDGQWYWITFYTFASRWDHTRQGLPSSCCPGTWSIVASLTLMMSLVLQLLGPLLTRISFLGCLAQITHDRFLFVFFFLADFICEPGIKRSLLKCQYLILVISDFVEEAGSAGSIMWLKPSLLQPQCPCIDRFLLETRGWGHQWG